MADYSCPECGGEGFSLGCLGFLAWFRCRHCGMDYSVLVRALDAEMQELQEDESLAVA